MIIRIINGPLSYLQQPACLIANGLMHKNAVDNCHSVLEQIVSGLFLRRPTPQTVPQTILKQIHIHTHTQP